MSDGSRLLAIEASGTFDLFHESRAVAGSCRVTTTLHEGSYCPACIYRLALLISLWGWNLERFTRALCSKGFCKRQLALFRLQFFRYTASCHSDRLQFLPPSTSLTQKLLQNFKKRTLRSKDRFAEDSRTVRNNRHPRRRQTPCCSSNRHA